MHMLGKRIAIHSGMKYDKDAQLDILDELPFNADGPPNSDRWPGGFIHSTAVIKGFIEHDGDGSVIRAEGMTIEEACAAIVSPWVSSEPGFAWLMTEPRMLETPIAVKGSLGLWRMLLPVLEAVRAQAGSEQQKDSQ